ncbi:MAG: DUF4169 family protein [Rhodobacteraceae bacterium]|nr:DUF4169 family protein [Paracoccaceae bacterium]
MGNVINLRQVRKKKTRAEKREISAASTAVSGVKKPEHTRAGRLKDIADSTLDGHKREDET